MRPVILEGPDGAGKSTLAERLSQSGARITKNGPPNADGDLLWYYIEQVRAGGVIDRSALSERVYGPILRGKDRIGFAGWQTFQAVCLQEQAIQILCLPPPLICHERWLERANAGGELTKDNAVFWQTYAHYAWMARDGKFKVVDWTAATWSNQVDELRGRMLE